MDGGGEWTFFDSVIIIIKVLNPRSQSRMRGDYLFYEEKVQTTQDERDSKAARR